MATTFAVTANVDGAIKCTDCGAALHTGDTYAIYPSGLYGITRNGAPCHERKANAQPRRGRRGARRADVPAVKLAHAATCAQCGAPLKIGADVKLYTRRDGTTAVYGMDCHHGAARTAATPTAPMAAVALTEVNADTVTIAAQIAAMAAQIAALASQLAGGTTTAPMAASEPMPEPAKPADAFIFPKDARFVVKALDHATGKRVTVRSQEDICHALNIGHWCTRLDETHSKPGARYGAADKPNIAIVKYLADHPDAITVWDTSDEDPQRVDWVQFTKLGGFMMKQQRAGDAQ